MVNWIEHLCIVGFFHILFLTTSLIFKRENKKANVVLSSLLILIALDLISMYIKVGGKALTLPLISRFMLSSVYLYGSIVYLYTKIQTGSNTHTYKSIVFHTVPPIISILFFIYINPYELSSKSPLLFYLHLYVGYFYLIINLILSYRAYNVFSKQIKHYFSSIKYIKQLWIKVILSGAIIILASSLINDIFDKSKSILILEPNSTNLITVSITLIFLFIIGLIVTNQPEITLKIQVLKKKNSAYDKTNLSAEQVQNYSEKIMKLLKKDKIFLQDDLTLNMLAKEVSIEPHTLSMVLNSVNKINFYTLINNYRVEEAKKILLDKESANLTIIEIAYMSGFNSKATFYSHFKRITGTTPTKFKKK